METGVLPSIEMGKLIFKLIVAKNLNPDTLLINRNLYENKSRSSGLKKSLEMWERSKDVKQYFNSKCNVGHYSLPWQEIHRMRYELRARQAMNLPLPLMKGGNINSGFPYYNESPDVCQSQAVARLNGLLRDTKNALQLDSGIADYRTTENE